MSKKGLIAIIKDNQIKATYVHRNAQLEAIGNRVVKLCRENSVGELKNLYDKLILVDEDAPMTKEQKDAYKKYMPEQLYMEDLDWTTVLKYTKDATAPLRDGFPYVVDYAGFLPSWRNRFRYIIDLDKGILKIVKGGLEIISQKEDVFFDDADYTEKIVCCVLAEFPLDNIPENWLEICKEKWLNMEIICMPYDEAAIYSNKIESDPVLQHSAKDMEFYLGVYR